MSTQPTQLDDYLDQLLNELVVPWDTSDLPPNVRITSPSLKIARTKKLLADYIQRALVEELKNLPNYKYAVGDIPALTFEGVPKEAINKRIKHLLSTIKVPLVVGGSAPHQRKEKT